MDKNFYVITSFFNPCQFKSRSRLYRNFAPHIEACGAKLITVEAAFGDHPFEVTQADNPMHVQLRTRSILWHKERMLNIGLNRLYHVAPESHNIGWFDADITFADPDWMGKTIHQLMRHAVVQPFSEAINLDSREQYMWHCPSTFRYFLEARGYHQDPPIPSEYLCKGHPGLAWASTRPVLDGLGGLYDLCAAGSGDTVMANCLKGHWDTFLPVRPSPGMITSMKRWAARCDSVVRANVGFAPGAVLHHWHGKSEKRGYEKRWSIQAFHDFDPTTDLQPDSQGLYRWAGNKPRLEDDIRLSLCARNEDEL